jgi:transposase
MLRPASPTITRPWAPLSDAEWAALAPLLPRSRIRELRHRLNCILAVAAHAAPWVPSGAQGPFWPTLYRHYHRWARAGVWTRLHQAAEAAAAPPALRALADWAAALHRRAARILHRAAAQFLNSKAGPQANPLPTLAFPPHQPPRRLAELSGISPKSAELHGIEPPSTPPTPANPRCPEAFRALAGWLGGAAPLRSSPRCHRPLAAAPCRNGEGKRAA